MSRCNFAMMECVPGTLSYCRSCDGVPNQYRTGIQSIYVQHTSQEIILFMEQPNHFRPVNPHLQRVEGFTSIELEHNPSKPNKIKTKIKEVKAEPVKEYEFGERRVRVK